VVFTNGCFDLLHLGHARLLAEAKRAGDMLIVAVNADDSVRRLKGPDRPVIGQADRAGLVAALAAVDYVVIFDDDTPERLVRALRPDVLVKGAGDRGREVVGGRFVESYGGRVVLVEPLAGRSTTKTIDRAQRAETTPWAEATTCPVCESGDCQALADLRRCAICTHIFQGRAVITASYDETYLATYDRYPSERLSLVRVGLLKAFARRGRLLDFGYGNGALVRAALAAGYDAFGCDVHGVDRGVREIDPAADRSAWDVLCCFDSLEHLADFTTIRSLVKRARLVVVSTPLTPASFPADRRWKHYKAGEHLHYFSPKSLARLIGKPLIAETDVEDVIRHPTGPEQNIYTAVYGERGGNGHG
jgi:D-beta-D-heptose 7-phosphate kinase/D-beta-D-heptose 1-phosphate adenosyltransferase